MKTNTKTYLRQVRKAFPFFHKSERRFYRDFTFAVTEYAMQAPSCTVEDLNEEFGMPKDVVIDYFNSMESDAYFSIMKKSKYLKMMTISFVLF